MLFKFDLRKASVNRISDPKLVFNGLKTIQVKRHVYTFSEHRLSVTKYVHAATKAMPVK